MIGPLPSPFLLLGLSIITVWLPPLRGRWPWWPAVFGAACGTAWSGGVLDGAALASLVALVSLAQLGQRASNRHLRALSTLAAALLALALALHQVPGFSAPLLLDAVRLSPDAAPFSLYARFDTGAAGLILLAHGCRRCESAADWRALGVPAARVATGTALVVICASMLAGYVRFDPKLLSFTATFLAVNLLFTCIAEEAFFRGLLQHWLAEAMKGRAAARWLPIVLAGLLFGLAHAGGGPRYAAIATLAGIGYGIAYARTQRIEAAVLAHFAVNALHFLCFTYPRLGGL